MASNAIPAPAPPDEIPMPIIRMTHWISLTSIVLGFVLQQPLFTTALFFLLLPGVLFGPRASVPIYVGRRLLAARLPGAPGEHRQLVRFNNTIAFTLLSLAQVAFLLGLPLAGWLCAGMLAAANSLALAGFCPGCFLYYQLKLHRRQLFGRRR